MIQEYQIRVLPEQAANEQNIKLFISKDKGIDARTIKAIRVLKRSIDARQRTIYVNLKVRLYINELPQDEEFVRTIYNNVRIAVSIQFHLVPPLFKRFEILRSTMKWSIIGAHILPKKMASIIPSG